MSNQLYPSDMTDREWEYIKGMIPAAKPGGRRRGTDMRQTLNAIFYINRAGRTLPKTDRSRLEAAKDELRALFGRPRSKA